MTMWMENGGCYIAKRELWLAGRRLGRNNGAIEMPWWDSLEIDDPEDLEVARAISQFRRVELNPVQFVTEEIPGDVRP